MKSIIRPLLINSILLSSLSFLHSVGNEQQDPSKGLKRTGSFQMTEVKDTANEDAIVVRNGNSVYLAQVISHDSQNYSVEAMARWNKEEKRFKRLSGRHCLYVPSGKVKPLEYDLDNKELTIDEFILINKVKTGLSLGYVEAIENSGPDINYVIVNADNEFGIINRHHNGTDNKFLKLIYSEDIKSPDCN